MISSRYRSIATLLLATSLAGCTPKTGSELRIAVASNFTDAMTKIAGRFQAETGRKVTLSFGSTGKHYAQIRNGAPFDLFFAADVKRPTLLEKEGVAIPGSRFTYAIGKLVLWSADSGFVDARGDVLTDSTYRFLAMANPDLAPYGRAARQVLMRMGVWDGLSRRIVQGENISQSYQFVRTGGAKLGFVAYSQVMRDGRLVEGSAWLVPDSLYAPIEQQAVLLKDTDPARAFAAFVKSAEGRQIIHSFGYDTP